MVADYVAVTLKQDIREIFGALESEESVATADSR